MVNKTLLIFFLIICCKNSFSQKQTNFWHFGTLAGLDFTGGAPVALTNVPLNTAEGSASISDASGNLLFFTDGVQVWDKTNTQMPNGFGLMGDASTTQSALIIPDPGNANLYYIFTLDDEGGGNGFRYSIVDITLNSGNGDITSKNVFLKSSMTEKLTAVHHCNNHDIWVTAHEYGTDSFYSYLVTDGGISTPVVSNTGIVQTDVHGQMKFNTAGTQIACAIGYIDVVQLFDFDKTNGTIYNPLTIPINHHAYGVEFSPDNSKLYLGYYDVASTSEIAQYDLNAANIAASKVVLGSSPDPIIYSIQQGPDGKVYVTKEITPFLSVINSPNLAGTACNYVDNAINLDPNGMGTMCMLGLPGFIQSYFNTSFPNIPCAVPVFADFYSDTLFCAGNCIDFTDSSSSSVTTWTWTFQGASPGTSSTENPQNICYTSPGNYTATLIVSNGTSSDTVTKNITVTGTNINAGADVTINEGENTQLSATGNVINYTWTPSTGLSSTTVPNPIATPLVTTTYAVTAQDANGCTATDSVKITIKEKEILCGEVFVPTAFSPNNDGQNEMECLMGDCITSFVFSIYDRWGENVFTTTDQAACWDGKYKGQALNAATFVYYLNATLQNGETIVKKGNISLVR